MFGYKDRRNSLHRFIRDYNVLVGYHNGTNLRITPGSSLSEEPMPLKFRQGSFTPFTPTTYVDTPEIIIHVSWHDIENLIFNVPTVQTYLLKEMK